MDLKQFMKLAGNTLPNLRLSLKDFPQLKKLIKGQKMTLRIKGKTVSKIMSGADADWIEISTDGLDYEEDGKMSTQQILQDIASNLGSQNISLG